MIGWAEHAMIWAEVRIGGGRHRKRSNASVRAAQALRETCPI